VVMEIAEGDRGGGLWWLNDGSTAAQWRQTGRRRKRVVPGAAGALYSRQRRWTEGGVAAKPGVTISGSDHGWNGIGMV
jgi:hypothetical protein